jgi:hypothetical protein
VIYGYFGQENSYCVYRASAGLTHAEILKMLDRRQRFITALIFGELYDILVFVDLNEKYTYWLDHAQYDLDSADVMYRGGP